MEISVYVLKNLMFGPYIQLLSLSYNELMTNPETFHYWLYLQIKLSVSNQFVEVTFVS